MEAKRNTTYIVNGNMAADITGPAIAMGPYGLGELTIVAVTTATGTPNGTFQLQGSNDGTNWATISAAATQFPNSGSAGNIAAGTYAWIFSGLNFEFVRLFYDAASGGTGATLNASTRVR